MNARKVYRDDGRGGGLGPGRRRPKPRGKQAPPVPPVRSSARGWRTLLALIVVALAIAAAYAARHSHGGGR